MNDGVNSLYQRIGRPIAAQVTVDKRPVLLGLAHTGSAHHPITAKLLRDRLRKHTIGRGDQQTRRKRGSLLGCHVLAKLYRRARNRTRAVGNHHTGTRDDY